MNSVSAMLSFGGWTSAITTLHLRETRCWTKPQPIPDAPPVTIATGGAMIKVNLVLEPVDLI